MPIDEGQRAFIERRRRFVRTWPLVGWLLLILLSGLAVWLYIRSPLLVNPFEAASRLSDGTVDNSTLAPMAGLLPVMTLTCLVLVSTIVLFAFHPFLMRRNT